MCTQASKLPHLQSYIMSGVWSQTGTKWTALNMQSDKLFPLDRTTTSNFEGSPTANNPLPDINTMENIFGHHTTKLWEDIYTRPFLYG